jgi:CTP:molybdopterin cytidylyltransferase MocA
MMRAAARRRARLACVLLAAGGSSRLGRPKQLVRRGRRPLLTNALLVAREALGPDARIVVVLGADALRLRALLRRTATDVRIALNARWRSGLASSLQKGIAALPIGTDAALVLLVDQPDVTASSLRRLLAAWRARPTAPAAARYAKRVGVPAVLPRRSWREVRALEGDVGARALLRGRASLTLVDLPEAAFDVDTLDDLRKL